MKLHLSIFAALFISMLVKAQPVLTGNDINPVPGDELTYHLTSYVNPGSPGANQFWNLSSMVENGSEMISYINPSSTPYASSFPTSNVAGKSSTGIYYSYYNVSSSALQVLGLWDNVTMVNSDPQDFLRYPLNYTDSFTDYFSGNYMQSTQTSTVMVTRTGTNTVTYDGYGTLVIPSGTYTNVVRAHVIYTYYDNGNLGYLEDSYIWFLPGHHMELASVINFSGQTSSSQGYYTDYGFTGIIDQAMPMNANLFPNPAVNEVHISVPHDISITQANMYSTDGKLVLSLDTETTTPVNGMLTFNTSELMPGIYFIKLISTKTLIEVKKVVIVKQ